MHKILTSETIAMAKNRQKEALTEVYHSYFERIYRFAFFRLGSKESAEDVTSEIFLRLVEKIDKYKENQGSFSSWIYTLARHEVANFYRRKKDYVNLEAVTEMAVKEDVEKELDLKNKLLWTKEKLADLPERQREVLLLRVWDEMSHEEISEILSISEGASKMALTRALSTLKEDWTKIATVLFTLKSIL